MSKPFERFPFAVNMKVRMKKPHPCGSDLWRVIRTGADIKLQCESCGRYISLTRRQLESAVREIVQQPGDL